MTTQSVYQVRSDAERRSERKGVSVCHERGRGVCTLSRSEDNPYRSPAAPPDGAASAAGPSRGLTCPYCEHRFPLTWKRYVLAPTGVHLCPACGKRGKLRLTAAYLLALVVTDIALQGGGALAGYLLAHIPGLVVGLALAFAISFAFDKHYDQRLRALERTDAMEKSNLTG